MNIQKKKKPELRLTVANWGIGTSGEDYAITLHHPAHLSSAVAEDPELKMAFNRSLSLRLGEDSEGLAPKSLFDHIDTVRKNVGTKKHTVVIEVRVAGDTARVLKVSNGHEMILAGKAFGARPVTLAPASKRLLENARQAIAYQVGATPASRAGSAHMLPTLDGSEQPLNADPRATEALVLTWNQLEATRMAQKPVLPRVVARGDSAQLGW